MRRREFITLLGGATVAGPLAAHAQQKTDDLPRIGIIQSFPNENFEALTEGLREAGYIDGQNVLMEKRFHGAALDRIDAFANELAALKCKVIFAGAPYGIQAVLKATNTIPIVGVDLESDPVASGWAQSLARPGGNLTGLFLDLPELGGKQIELLREAAPRLSHLAVLWDATIGMVQFRATELAAGAAKLTLQSLPIRRVEDVKDGFEEAARKRVDGIVVLSSPLILNQRSQIADLALGNRLPTISIFTSFPKVGGLMAYGPNLASMFKQAASYISRILSGAKPGELPIERPSKFELLINFKTAKALGLAVPLHLQQLADEVIE
jgi:putative tryptophan/tyrosine transport system substrate-binding protein